MESHPMVPGVPREVSAHGASHRAQSLHCESVDGSLQPGWAGRAGSPEPSAPPGPANQTPLPVVKWIQALREVYPHWRREKLRVLLGPGRHPPVGQDHLPSHPRPRSGCTSGGNTAAQGTAWCLGGNREERRHGSIYPGPAHPLDISAIKGYTPENVGTYICEVVINS